ncbi:MAG TPA: endo-1,4-beta-xylanase [Caulobacteraceae bacterium]|nr:endo-1,4-beta-xylanase [Caulobacteraceae bacterium]
MTALRPSRRLVLAGAAALAGCDARATGEAEAADPPPLKSVAPFPIGCCVWAQHLDDPVLASLIADQVSQVTPEFQMKMEYIVQPDGSFRFDAPDRIAAFAREHGIRLFGHTLVWYAEKPDAFVHLDESRTSFRDAYVAYITAVVGRYRGQAVAWDVVNEAVNDDGQGWRDCLWSQKLGPLEHMRLAYETAHAADPNALLLLNDYWLERTPAKRATFLKLAEALLKAGAPLGGLGTQTHIDADLPKGAITAAIKDLASLGLPIHLSEMDVSIDRVQGFHRRGALEAAQSELYTEAAHAFSSLPARQRFAFTTWGLRDRESWLVRDLPNDTPLLFDRDGRPKPVMRAFEAALRG